MAVAEEDIVARGELELSATTKAQPFGPYRLRSRLAKGGMGEVFLADDEDGKRSVVVKVLSRDLASQSDILAMFWHEARLGSALDHPNIAKIYDYGSVSGRPYLVMEYVAGPPLSKIWKQCRGQLPLGAAVDIVIQVAWALAHAHGAIGTDGEPLHIVHRDVTPHNIMVSSHGEVKLIDFGVAKSDGQDHRTKTGILKGKLTYMAPEQFKGAVSSHTDIFALGAILHELVSGRRLFRRGTEAETFAAILSEPIPPIAADPHAVRALGPIVARMLARHVEQRYGDALMVADALEGARRELGLRADPDLLANLATLQGEPRNSRPPSLSGVRSLAPPDPASISFAPDSGEISDGAPIEVHVPDELQELLDSFDDGQAEPLEFGAVGLGSASAVGRHPSEEAWATDRPAKVGRSSWRSPLVAAVCGAALAAGGVTLGLAWSADDGSGADADPTASVGAAADEEGRSSANGGSFTGSQDERGSDVAGGEAALAPIGSPPSSGASATAGIDESASAGNSPGTVVSPQPPDGRERSVGRGRAGGRSRQGNGSSGRALPSSTPAVPIATGRLFVDSDPWTYVRLGDRSLGPTPIVNVEVPAGQHTLRLRDAAGEEHQVRVRIEAGRPTKRFVRLAE